MPASRSEQHSKIRVGRRDLLATFTDRHAISLHRGGCRAALMIGDGARESAGHGV
jgi:hypothetical protein